MSNAAPLTAPAGMERAKAPFAFADLWALVLRYAFNTMGPISIAGAHFLASLLFLRFLPPAQFGLFSFVFVVVPFALRLEACRSGARLVTARHLRRTGALEIRPAAEDASGAFSEAHMTPAVESLDRPWARHRTYDWRTGSFDPPKVQ